jgi:Xaa-Pro aminopeptidase
MTLLTEQTYSKRRAKLLSLLPGKTLLLHNGIIRQRNITASGYPFRANSNFLFFFGRYPPASLALISADGSSLFVPIATPEEVVWDGPGPSLEELRAASGAERIFPLGDFQRELGRRSPESLCSLPHVDAGVNHQLGALLGRPLSLEGADREAGLAVIECRLCHDEAGVEQLREAADVTAHAFARGFEALTQGADGYEILAAIEGECLRRGATTAFPTTLTVHGEVLHNPHISRTLSPGQLLLVDMGAEIPSGYSADVTRTWPVSGMFSSPQRELYELVLNMQRAAVAAIRPGGLFGEVHHAACRCCAEGLIALGLLRGNVDEAVERGAHTLFFPHGIGHLVGLDVHDMEDLGDLAGYADGQTRDTRFGWNNLRLNRKLRPHMLLTIEPGLYWIPALLDDPLRTAPFGDILNRARFERFRGFGGIRIEDNVFVLESGVEETTRSIPKSLSEVAIRAPKE